jgi:hypothetical protein
MAEQPDAITLLREELAEAKAEIASLQVKTVTTLSGTDLITIVMLAPLVFAFVALGIIVVWKTTSSPATVAPHLDLILLALAVFGNPVSAAMGAVMTRYADQHRNGGKKDAT